MQGHKGKTVWSGGKGTRGDVGTGFNYGLCGKERARLGQQVRLGQVRCRAGLVSTMSC